MLNIYINLINNNKKTFLAVIGYWANNARSGFGNWIYCKLVFCTNVLKVNGLEIFLNSKTRWLTVRTAVVELQSCRCSCWSGHTRSRLVSAGTSAGRMHFYVKLLEESMQYWAFVVFFLCIIVHVPKDAGGNLHRSGSLSAFKHEYEVLKVSHCCLPRNKFSLISKETGRIQS